MKKHYLFLAVLAAIFIAYAINYALIDRSARSYGDGVVWKGITYIPANHFTTPRNSHFLAEDQYGASIVGYGEGPEYIYIMRSSFLDNYLLVRDDYQIKTSGKITAIAVKSNQIELTPERLKIKSILDESLAKPYYCGFKTNNDLMRVEFSYNKSQVTDNLVGWIALSGKHWYYIPKLSAKKFRTLYNRKKASLNCYRIDSKYKKLFDEIPFIYNWYNDPEYPRSIQVEPVKINPEILIESLD